MGYISRFFTVLLVSLVALCSYGDKGLNPQGPSQPGTPQEELSILFIGNSFTMDAVNHLPGIGKVCRQESLCGHTDEKLTKSR
jgi:hypothetical protein